jgi:hypothetical protein
MHYLDQDTRLLIARERQAELLRAARGRPVELTGSRAASRSFTPAAAARALVTGVWRRRPRLVRGASPEPL